tara:strand:+ start:486 stop:1577 length:1092 start_codon:yes stop_codon:yes gene_type:complete
MSETENTEPSGPEQQTNQSGEKPKFEVKASRQFVNWMQDEGISLGFSTYQSGKVFVLGHNDQGRMSIFERSFPRPMGLWSDGQTMLMTSLYQIHRLYNTLPKGQLNDGYDRLFVPKTSYITGDLDIHDLQMDPETDQPIFINTLFCCLATTSKEHSFKPLWKPKFITQLAPEDRCHLNGLAMKDGKPAYVTAVSETNISDGWREHRGDGGVVIDIETNEVVCRGLSMPHSPRWHNGKLWVANSGRGEYGYVNFDTGKFEPIAFCPGFIRGAAMHGNYAVVGLSKPRNDTFQGLELDDRLEKEKVSARSGLFVIDLTNGTNPHWLQTEGIVSELYDVISLPGIKRPSLIGFQSDQIRRVISIES